MTSTTTGAVLAAASTLLSSTVDLSLSATSLLAASTQIPTGNSTQPPQNDDSPADAGQCHLLGPFAILVQGALGALALLSLVYKRWRERPQRPVKIWAFDASKQVFGTVLLHLANLLMSMFSAGQIEAQLAKAAAKTVGAETDDNWRPNPCSFYLLNLGIDTTLGIPILLIILKVLTVGASKTPLANPPESIKSGNYGDPPRATWWLKQSILYFIGLLGMKVCVFFIFHLCPWIVVVGDWALKWTEGNTALQIAFVMLIFPLIMNAFQYYVIDTFIKKKPEVDDGASQHSHSGSEGERGGLLAGDEHVDHQPRHGDSIDEDVAYKAITRSDSTDFPDRAGGPNKQRRNNEDAEETSSGSSTIAERELEQASSRVPKPAE
ncbi:hypothetical protein PMZ80_000928 [Knufia obscura]|uniref:Vacuolar membrane protein n=1 Tax=Knufia obscura TaxID=1635080 RepID=A0ABR0S1Q9_9EURO|nr:hypothetical protein PMZ80_000928 [Knufia obscura]